MSLVEKVLVRTKKDPTVRELIVTEAVKDRIRRGIFQVIKSWKEVEENVSND